MIEIKCTENGSKLIVVNGNVTTALCMCGGANKPYCDGTREKIGFQAVAKEIKISEWDECIQSGAISS